MIRNSIPYGHQHITEEDIEAVTSVLRSEYLTQGPRIKEFEENFAKYVGCKYAVAVSNGTAALHLSAMALNVNPGDKVIVTPLTFVASANCIRYCGGEVVFADIDPKTYLLDINEVKKMLEVSPKGTYQGIIPVDFSGRAVNMEEFRKVADEYDLWILEDACHAPGGYFVDSNNDKQFCGNGNYADLAIFSFHPVKHITAGEGGMITTNDEELYKKLLSLRTHGITKDASLFQNTSEIALGIQQTTDNTRSPNDAMTNDAPNANDFPSWYYEMQQLGFNYRLTDFQAALGNEQLKRADEGLTRRREIAQNYSEAFKDKPFIKGQSGVVDGHGYHLYIIEVENRKGLYEHLRTNNIFAQIHYVPVHLMPYYKQFGWKSGDFPVAEQYYSQCISLPMYPTLTKEEQKFVITCIKNFYNNK
jgi:hypothetical protein